jgi:hypothetical protein
MANFDKFANLSPRGWTKSSATQTIAIGQNAHIGLWGGGPSGVDLEVKSTNAAVCVVHEEPRPKGYPNWRHFLLSALTDGDAQVNAYLPGTLNVWAAMTVKVTGHTSARLVFFPGERMKGKTILGTIYVVGGTGESMVAAGGPTTGYTDPTQGGHTAEPTPAGQYTLGPMVHVITAGWPMSVIPWGATLRISAKGEVEYEQSPGHWRAATGPSGDVTQASMSFYHRSHLHPTLTQVAAQTRNIFVDPKTGNLRSPIWEKNDFGRWGWNLRQNGHPTAYYIHTTPEDEHATAAKKAVLLANSHGCIHLVPSERERLIKAGYLKEGIHFEVRPYTEIGPP